MNTPTHPAPRTPRPMTVRLTGPTVQLIRLHRGEKPAAVIHRALLLLGQAENRVDSNGRPKREHA